MPQDKGKHSGTSLCSRGRSQSPLNARLCTPCFAVLVPAHKGGNESQGTAGGPEATPSNARLDHASVLEDQPFGQRYAYGFAEGAALNPLEPWRMAAAVGRDVGQFLMGSVGLAPSQARPEADEEKMEHSACNIMNGKLKKQADECRARRNAAKLRGKGSGQRHKGSDGTEPAAEQAVQDAGPLPGEVLNSDALPAGPHPEGSHPPEPITEDAGPHQAPEQDGGGEKGEGGSDDSTVETSTSDSEDEKANGKGKGGEDYNLNRDSVSSSQATGDITVSGTGHYNPNNDALLRLETMTANQVRFMNFALWLWLTMALGFLVYLFAQKLIDENAAVRNYHSLTINIVMGGIAFLLVSGALLSHMVRIGIAVYHKKVWKPRRLKTVIYVTCELFATWLNLLFFILPNAKSFGPSCFTFKHPAHIAYFSLVRWTCWNTIFLLSLIHAHNACLSQNGPIGSSAGRSNGLSGGGSSLQARKSLRNTETRKDQAVMDFPFLHAHWWKLIIWVLMEGAILGSCLLYATTYKNVPVKSRLATDCGEIELTCRVSNTQLGITSLMIFFVVVYFLLYCFFLRRSLTQLNSRPASDFKIANVVIRIQMRLRLPAFTLFMLSMLLLWFVKPFSCDSLVYTWFGMLPGQLAATASALLYFFVGTPTMCGGQGTSHVLQVWLQEFAWTEEEKPRKLARRNSSVPPNVESELVEEPMFCVDTMMKALYWSLLIYDFQEVSDSKLNLEEGCALFDPPLEHYELFWEKSLDTKLILAWSRNRVVMAFRGTASMANVVADLQAWRVIHEPKRGLPLFRPKVHSGFDKAWRNNGFNTRIMKRIADIFISGEVDRDHVHFLITGHSLGGALATLAAYEVQAAGRRYGCKAKVTCVTFGAPRTGNHSFARDFENMVPDCWHVINDQDVVARGAKFVALYKRGGHRVLINPLGDLIVRPNALESSLRLVPCSGSVQQHLLTSYLHSLLHVLLAQFSEKRIVGGMSGVVQLAKRSEPIKKLLLEEANLTYEDLVYRMRWGAYAPRVAHLASLAPMTARKKGAAARDAANRGAGEPSTSTRGGFLFGCCTPTSLKVKEARGDDSSAADAHVVDGGDVDPTSNV